MSIVVERLAAAGLSLPTLAAPVGAYVPAVAAGSLVFTSGQLPMSAGALLAAGLVGEQVDIEVAQACARQCALNALAAAATVCDLDEVLGVVKLTGFVACGPGFSAQPTVINGASDVMAVAFGESGRHAREAVGVASLPLGAPVEVSLTLFVR